jgi:hypothetical protein
MDINTLHERAAAEKWERERANEGAYERWLATGTSARVDAAIKRADKVRTLSHLRRAIRGE